MIGLDISDRSVKIIELTDEKIPRLRTACWGSLPPNLMRRGIIRDPVKTVTAIQAIMKNCNPVPLASSAVVASIPETRSFVRVVELPVMSDRETDEAVQWAIRQHIPFDLDRVYLDWQPIINNNPSSNRRAVLVGAAQKEVIDPLLSVLDSLELRVVGLELEAQAIVRSLLPFDNADIASVLLLDLGATSTNIIYFDQGAMRFTSSLPRGGDDLTRHLMQKLHLQPSIAAEKKALVGVAHDASDPTIAAALREATLNLVQQIDKTVHEVVSTGVSEHKLNAIVLTGGAANLPGITEVFAEVFPSTAVQFGNPLINLEVDDGNKNAPLSSSDAAHFGTAIGLALRDEEKEEKR